MAKRMRSMAPRRSDARDKVDRDPATGIANAVAIVLAVAILAALANYVS